MKSLSPSNRDKKRYLLIKGNDANKPTIESVILEFIGVLGYAEASPFFVKTFDKNSTILSVNRKTLNKIRTSFLMSKKDLRITRVSGSISKLKKD